MTVTESLSTIVNFNATGEKLTSQIVALESKLATPSTPADEVIKEVIAEKQSMLSYLLKDKEWNFNFEGGGWNTVYAAHKEEAIQKAMDEYCNSPNLNPDPKSFRVATAADTAKLMSMFY